MSGILWQARATFKSYATYWLMKGINNDEKHIQTHSEQTIYSGREMMNESNEMSESDEGKLVTYKIWWIIFFELVGISSTRTSNIWNFILKAIYHFWLWQANGYDEERNGTHTRKKKHRKWSKWFQYAFFSDYHLMAVFCYRLIREVIVK